MEVESMKHGKATVEKCLEELFKKSDLTPAETKAALDGMNLRDLLTCEIEDCKMKEKEKEDMEYSERGYSGHDTPYRQYHITSYGRPMRMSRSDGSYRPMRISYGGRMMDDYSGDYGVQGWYRSGDDMSNCGPDPYYYSDGRYREDHRYSRHSIGDRVVEKLEHMMDTTSSEYEKEELHKFIRMVRSAAD